MKKKFRIYDTFTKKMIVEDFHMFGEVMMFGLIEQYLDKNPNPEYSSSLLRFNDVVVMQFTGREDKKEKSIYESDIVNFKRYGAKIYDVGEIFFSEAYFCWSIKCYYNKLKNDFYSVRLHEAEEIEIIGNIYENSELLNG